MGILGRPSPGNVTKAFGVGGHKGTDRGHGNGLGVYAMAAGNVTGVRDFDDYGLTVTIDHGRLIDGKRTQTRYRHLSARTVTVGADVTQGQLIATQGADGYLTDQVHLHSELLLDGVLSDEQRYQSAFGTAGGEGTPITETKDERMTYRAVISNTTRVFYFDSLSLTEVVAGSPRDVALARFVGISALTITTAELAEYQAWVNANRAALPGGPGGGYSPADADVVDEAELGGALTSTVTLINAHADANRDQILDKINGLGISHS